jgi:hypothetical protein
MNIPGFTAEASLCLGGGRHQEAINQEPNHNQQGVIAQLRAGGGIGVGGGRHLGGFWDCVVCVAICTIIVGDGAACLTACQNSGACTVTALA